jgi:hypothetical protein
MRQIETLKNSDAGHPKLVCRFGTRSCKTKSIFGTANSKEIIHGKIPR